MNRLLYFLLVIFLINSSCTEKSFISGKDFLVQFSDDTIHFDTVFTTIGTATREVRIINPFKDWIKLDHIYLGREDLSYFRLNIDGEPVTEYYNLEIPPGDSIFIFIDANIDPTNDNSPVAIVDSIVISSGNFVSDINLIAWGQDINLVNGGEIHNETWQNDKPYVIYNSMLVDTGYQLKIEKGTRIMFHRGSTMYIAGTLIVEGTVDEPVIFSSDRMEEIYADIPGQWNGLYFINSSSGNKIDYSIIRNAVSGIHLGNINSIDIPPDLKISNSIIEHMSASGISSIGATICAFNCIVSHCGFYCLFLVGGGDYEFSHCTIANNWEYSLRLTPSIAISDFIEYDDVVYAGNLEAAEFNNSVVFGSLASEVGIFPLDKDFVLNCTFFSSLLKLDTTNSRWKDWDLSTCLINAEPLFIDPLNYDFRPDTLSPLLDAADLTIADKYPFDIRYYPRFNDAGPDIGVYERQIGEISEEK